MVICAEVGKILLRSAATFCELHLRGLYIIQTPLKLVSFTIWRCRIVSVIASDILFHVPNTERGKFGKPL
jgi:hypothetical protein